MSHEYLYLLFSEKQNLSTSKEKKKKRKKTIR